MTWGAHASKKVATTTPGPWAKWRIKRRHLRAIKFIETYCAAPKGSGFGKPLKLAPFQKEWLEAALADGVDAAVLATPRGNGKSSFGGALAVWAVFDDAETGAPQVPIMATTVGQAIRSCYGVSVSMIRHSEELLNRALIFTGIGTSRVEVPSNEGVLFPIANTPDGLQGLDPSFGIVDEIGFQPMESWDSLRLAGGKRDRSLIVGVGTPGIDRDNALYHLRERVREGGELPRFHLTEYAAPDDCAIDDRAAWRVANPALDAGFLRESALEADLAITPEPAFRAFRLGQWVEGVDSWLGEDGPGLWEALTNPYDLVDGAKTWVGVDIGRVRDTTAVVSMQRREDGRAHAIAWILVPEPGRPLDTSDVMHYLRELDERYDVQSIAYDPRLFETQGDALADEGLPMRMVPQSTERMTGIIGRLYEAIQTRAITHDGDPAFATQVLNGAARWNDLGFTLSKSKSRGKIDAAIALALAYDQASREEGPSAYETQGLTFASAR